MRESRLSSINEDEEKSTVVGASAVHLINHGQTEHSARDRMLANSHAGRGTRLPPTWKLARPLNTSAFPVTNPSFQIRVRRRLDCCCRWLLYSVCAIGSCSGPGLRRLMMTAPFQALMVSTRSAVGTYGLMVDARMAMPSQYDADRTDEPTVDCASGQEPSFAAQLRKTLNTHRRNSLTE
jgi:hypothetical protein